MFNGFCRLSGLVRFRVLLCMLLIAPGAAVAQEGSPVASAAQPASDPQAGDATKPGSDILNLDIEQLAKTPVVVPSMDIPVTSVTKEVSTVGRSPAAVFVITQEMIHRSGATCIPEALRMAPGLEVAQINSNSWAISARGFTAPYSNKLLVLIDGRSVYNPDFSGVYWDMQDVLLEDVERIEVIRGPGSTLWGANAVNGVINVITKRTKDTQGAYVTAGGGTHERSLDGFRYGGQIGEDATYRVHGKYFDRGPDFNPTGQAQDAWQQGRFGFRADWEPNDKTDVITIQGDHFLGNTGNSVVPTNLTIPDHQTGENLLARWRHVYDERSDWTLQAYYDHFMRDDVLQTEDVKTLDVEFQYRFPLTDRHSITCGAGFRNVGSFCPGGDAFTTYFSSPYWTTNYINQFIQDEITLVDDLLAFTLGCKLEQNPYTGLEYQPTARLLWTPDRRHSCWGAVSRAVRTPSRQEEQAYLTTPSQIPGVYSRFHGNNSLDSEALLAYEIGYRTQATEQFSWDLALFYNSYDSLMAPQVTGMPFFEMAPPPPHVVVPLMWANGATAETSGVELAGNYSVSKRWRFYTQYTYFQMQVSGDPRNYIGSHNDPHNQVFLRSSWDLRDDLQFDLMARYVDSVKSGNTVAVPSYITMDLRLGWQARKNLELAVVGQNLLQQYHYEFNPAMCGVYTTEVPRGVYGTMTWRR